MRKAFCIGMAALGICSGMVSSARADASLYAIYQRTQRDDVGRGGVGLELEAPAALVTFRALGEIGSQISNDPSLDYRVETHVEPKLPFVPYLGIGAEKYAAQSHFDQDIGIDYLVAGYRVRGKHLFMDAALRYQMGDHALTPALEGGVESNRRFSSFRYEHITPGLDLFSLRFGVRF